MSNHRLALPLAAAAVVLAVASMIAWAVSRRDDAGERPPVPPLAWHEEPTAAPLGPTDEPRAAAPLAPDDESAPAPLDLELTSLEPEPILAADDWPAPDEQLIAASGTQPNAADLSADLLAANAEVVEVGEQPVLWADGAASKSLRNRDFPDTYISHIEVDLTSPHHWVRLTWTGPEAARQETGPFHSSPGAGLGNNDCNDVAESNRDGSNCTPIGEFTVEAFSDTMRTYTQCRFVTWFNVSRAIAFHSYFDVPNYPASHGCVRLDEYAAQLIHNNSLMGKTKVTVGGTWTGR